MARARTARGEGMEETPALAAIKTYRYLDENDPADKAALDKVAADEKAKQAEAKK